MRIFSLVYLLFYCLTSAMAQDISKKYLDSLGDEELLELFNKVDHDSVKAEKVARTYLERGRAEGDTIKMARAYDRLAQIFSPARNISYADSIIELSKNTQNITYPAMGYILKAYNYSLIYDIRNEYENYLKAYRNASIRENLTQQVYIMDRLIYLQAEWGNKKSALDLQVKRHRIVTDPNYINEIGKSSRSGIKTNANALLIEEVIRSYRCYVFCYLMAEEFELANLYCNKLQRVIEESTNLGSPSEKDWIIDAKMEIEYGLGNYAKSIEASNFLYLLITEENKFTSKFKNLNIYKGLSLMKQKNIDEGLKHLLLADSIHDLGGNLNPHNDRLLFDKLKSHYSQINEPKKTLHYLNKLLYIDSIFKTNYLFFESEHNEKFQTPILLAEKEDLISTLEEKNNKADILLRIAIYLFLVSLVIGCYYFYRQRMFKKRFEKLLATMEKTGDSSRAATETTNEIPPGILNEITNKLNQFERHRNFLNHNISLHILAKRLETNSNYLSRVVNFTKEKNFSQYIHDLRLDYAIKVVLADPKFRKYTIKAIAQECGYSSADSFSRAFYKKNGIYPSYYIKKLEKSPI
ncbi:MAG: helix-turn-helix domain-containing protein [Bacteroidota bacterium]